jgi:hypothetical protein
MYPECRHIRPSGGTCNSPAIKGSHWCYFHGRLHQRQTVRHSHRRADGRFVTQPAPHAETEALDYGSIPVAEQHRRQNDAPAVPFDLPPIEDAASIQLALIDILQALTGNQLDPKRAGLLLYGLQVASANIRNIDIPHNAVRTVSHTDDGAPLAPQNYGFDVEDYEKCDEECGGCEVCGDYEDDDEEDQ